MPVLRSSHLQCIYIYISWLSLCRSVGLELTDLPVSVRATTTTWFSSEPLGGYSLKWVLLLPHGADAKAEVERVSSMIRGSIAGTKSLSLGAGRSRKSGEHLLGITPCWLGHLQSRQLFPFHRWRSEVTAASEHLRVTHTSLG